MGVRRVKYSTNTKDEVKERNENHQYVPMKRVCGKVKDWDGKPAHNAVIRLYKVSAGEDLEYIRQIFADEDGEFDFGLLREDVEYTLKVWYKEAKVKKITLSEQRYGSYNEDYGDEEDGELEE